MQDLMAYRDNPISVHDSVATRLLDADTGKVFIHTYRVLVMKTCNIKQESFFTVEKFLP
jgi:hypothetical protein